MLFFLMKETPKSILKTSKMSYKTVENNVLDGKQKNII